MKSRCYGLLAAALVVCTSSLSLARPPLGDPAEKLAELRQQRDTANDEWEQKMSQAKDQAESRKLWEARPGREFIEGFKAVAVEAKGTDTAREAWSEVFATASNLGVQDAAKLAVDATLADHVTSPELGSFAEMLGESAYVLGRDPTIAALQTVVEKSPHAQVRAPALLGLGSLLIEDGTPEQKVAGRKALDRLVADFAQEKPARGLPYAENARRFLFELDHLQIGMVAPNFESIDENGQKFSIADYRGKVVVLDFWGHW